jgi:acetylornithine/succinyldiaminopimelate/putrescine aminotransferase
LIELVAQTVSSPGFLAQVHRHGAVVAETIAQWSRSGHVRYSAGRGLWWILEPVRPAAEVENLARAAGLLVLPTQGTRIRLLPALNTSE